MRIVHVVPVWLAVSTQSHGGIETFVAELLVAQSALGHDVILVGAGGSDVAVPLIEAVPEPVGPLMERGEASEYEYYEQELVKSALSTAQNADVVHSHVVPGTFVLQDAFAGTPPVLYTLHGQVTEDLCWSLRRSPRAVVGVSYSQYEQAAARGASLLGVTHNGIDVSAVPFSASGGEELLFLGRMEWRKGPDMAIRAACEVGRPLTLAGPITDRQFFEAEVEPLLGPQIRYVGVLDREGKRRALARSCCLLVPSRWSEPFGMVCVEAMAAGTPIAAMRSGALPEVVDDGVTGRVVATEGELPAAVIEASALDRTTVRRAARERFDVGVVARAYLAHYQRLAKDRIAR